MKSLAAAQRMLIDLGLPPRAHIASGMEGHVFAIGNERVAKVWHAKRPDELAVLRSFYEMVDGLALPFATPIIHAIHDGPEGAVSVERVLPGTPMSEVLAVEQESMPAFAIDAVMSVLTALRSHPVRNGQRPLPMVGIVPPDEAAVTGPITVLLDVVDRKVERFGDQLRRSVRDFDEVYSQTMHRLQQFAPAGGQIVHGDLCPPNILLGPDLTVSAVVDWGFLSHVGDSAFDTSIACGTYDMYGPFARHHDDALVSACVSRHGYDRHRLLIYRALYAVLTSNAYSDDGTDGHYAWCVGNLNRADIRDALFA